MRISSMTFHALNLLFRLARQTDKTPLSASELADTSSISEHFIQKIMRMLQGSGIVRSIRGIAGGFVLAKAPREISLSDIVVAVEGGISLPEVKENVFANNAVVSVWTKAVTRMMGELSRLTLMDLFVQNAEEEKVAVANLQDGRNLRLSLGRSRCRRPKARARHIVRTF